MSPLTGAVFAAVGAALVDLQLLYASLLKGEYRLNRVSSASWLVAEFIRIGLGALVGYAMVATHQVSGGWGAFMVGVGTPLLLERLVQPLVALSRLERSVEIAESRVIDLNSPDVLDLLNEEPSDR